MKARPLLAILTAAFVGSMASLCAAEALPGPLFPGITPVCPCESLTNISLPNTTIDSAKIDSTNGGCRVIATVTHPPAGDRIMVWIGLPITNWNGRFRGNGGGGYVGGSAGA